MLSFKQSHAEIQNILDNAGSGGSGGTSDYTDLENKPQINSVTLTGNKTTSDLGINEVPAITSSDDNKVLRATYDDATENSYSSWITPPWIEDEGLYFTLNGIRIYVASTAPTGTIPEGSIGLGF